MYGGLMRLQAAEAAAKAIELHRAASSQGSWMDVKHVASLETVRKTARESLQSPSKRGCYGTEAGEHH
ncbi:hypothetical protein J3F83DRAFT_628462 [Trichoderma novae-zelandiae]